MVEAQDLVELEQRFWTSDVDMYRQRVTDDALMVFAEPVGILTKAQILTSIAGAARWADVRFENVQVRPVANDVVLLVYKATARRENDDDWYEALASSVYMKRTGEWMLAFHQQTPGATS